MTRGQPNILFLMADQMQAQVLNSDHPCQTPNFDRLATMGVRFLRAYTPNPVCSPARASLMTGLLPHNHGVIAVTHTVDDDQACLRTEHPHWAQRLIEAGYHTGYFGKWHVERSDRLEDFGWQVNGCRSTDLYKAKEAELKDSNPSDPDDYNLSMYLDAPPGYPQSFFYGVTNTPVEQRPVGIATELALDFLNAALAADMPWCCFVSVIEPHDPFVAGQDTFSRYNVDTIPLPPNANDPLNSRPNLYRKSAKVWQTMTDRQKREAAACYYASITEIDQQFGRLIDILEASNQLDNTIIILTSDHGELLGAHRLYTKNVGAYEEVYNIPLVMCGPGIMQNVTSTARVGLQDVCPTLTDLTGSEAITAPDCRSFASLLSNPMLLQANFSSGFAEHYGTRINFGQRVVWAGDWKYIFNGFDFDELYNLADDPYEMHNLVDDPDASDQLRDITALMWNYIKDTGDHSLLNSHYGPLRIAPFGPLMFQESS